MRPEGGAEDSGLRPCRVSAHLEGGCHVCLLGEEPSKKVCFCF